MTKGIDKKDDGFITRPYWAVDQEEMAARIDQDEARKALQASRAAKNRDRITQEIEENRQRGYREDLTRIADENGLNEEHLRDRKIRNAQGGEVIVQIVRRTLGGKRISR